MINRTRILSIGLLLLFGLLPSLAFAATFEYCNPGVFSVGRCHVSQPSGAPPNIVLVAFEGTYPDESSPVSTGTSYDPWIVSSDPTVGTSWNGQDYPMTPSTTWLGSAMTAITFPYWIGFAPPGTPLLYSNIVWYTQIDSSGNPAGINANTRIDTVTPADATTTATSTTFTFGATGYINSSDYVDGMQIRIVYSQPTESIVPGAAAASLQYIYFPISAPGAFTVSTTTPLLSVGDYDMNTSIQGYANLNFFGFFDIPFTGHDTTVNSTSTTFIAALQTGVDMFNASTSAGVSAYLASSTISLASCSSFTSFNLGDCLNLLLVPQPAQMQDQLNSFKSQFLSYFPWGYVTRFVTIIGTGGTTTLPTISIAINTPYSQGGGENDTTTLRFDENEMLANGAGILNGIDANGTDQNFRDVTEPYIDLFLAITILYIIIRDLLALRGGRK